MAMENKVPESSMRQSPSVQIEVSDMNEPEPQSEKPKRPPKPPSKSITSAKKYHDFRVLLANDEEVALLIISTLLKSNFGITKLDIAKNGKEAV